MSDTRGHGPFLGPRHLVGGTWRTRAEATAVALASAPAWVPILCAVWIWLAVSVGPALAFALGYSTLVAAWRPARAWARWAYWRARWWWDARAGGLSLNAERSITGTDTGIVDRDHVVVVPMVHRLELAPTGRIYTLRPLPGQSIDDYRAAVGRLLLRWSAVTVTVDHLPGSPFVRLTVADRLPPVQDWQQ